MSKSRTPNKQYLQTDRAVLLACIGLALIFWIFMKLSQRFQTTIKVDIQYEIPEGKVFTEFPPGQTDVKVEGVGWDLIASYLMGNQYLLRFDLMVFQLPSISHQQLLDRVSNQIGNLQIVDLSIDHINFTLEDKVQKKVPVNMEASWTFAEGYSNSSSFSIAPDSVLLEGGSTALESIAFWPTKAVKLEELKANLTESILLVEPENPLLSLDPKAVVLQMDVEQFTEKSFWIPVTVLNPPKDSLVIFPETIQLKCNIALSQFKAVEAADFELQLDFKNLVARTEKTAQALHLAQHPLFVNQISYRPQTVEFYVVEQKD